MEESAGIREWSVILLAAGVILLVVAVVGVFAAGSCIFFCPAGGCGSMACPGLDFPTFAAMTVLGGGLTFGGVWIRGARTR